MAFGQDWEQEMVGCHYLRFFWRCHADTIFRALFLRESGMGTFPVVPSLLKKPILLNKLCAPHDCLRSMWSSFSSGYHLIRAMATDSATYHSSVKQNKTNFSQHKLPWNGTRNFRTSVWDFLLNGTCTFRTSDWDFRTSFFSFKNVWHLNDTVWYLKNSKVALKRFWMMAYRDVWKPLENEELECLFERRKIFDMFAIKTCRLEGGQIIGH